MVERLVPPANELPLDDRGQWTAAWSIFWEMMADRVQTQSVALAATFTALAASTSYANDAAAAAGGVPVGTMYRNGSVVMIRVL